MKKFRVKLVGALAVGAFSVLDYAQMNRSEKMDDLMLANVEALASDEVVIREMCFGSGSIVCSYVKEKVEHVRIFYGQPD